MRCDEAHELLSDHLNGALPAAEADALSSHLEGCDACRRELADLRWVTALMQGLPAEPVPAGLGDRLHAALAALPDEAPLQTGVACDEAQDYLSGRLEGSLDAWEAEALTGHLADCAECRLALTQLEAVKTLLHAVPQEPLPATLAPRIHAALEAVPGEKVATGRLRIPCDEAHDYMSGHLDNHLDDWESRSLDTHLSQCAECQQMLTQLEAVKTLLRAVPQEPLPAGLGDRIHGALVALPAEDRVVQMRPARAKIFSWPSALSGAVAAVALFFVWNMQPGGLPRIETAAVTVQTDVALNIGFDVDESVEGVTFQIDLPEGLKFVDEKSQPMLAQSVSWKGSLVAGKTVVPIVVRGVRPGRYEIEAFVKKGPMMRKTTILLPVQAIS